jgi:cyclopropane fatty-acyl-phospholipid synthase-like methyltransferase
MDYKKLILEVGCHFGEFSVELATANPNALVIGTDKSESNISLTSNCECSNLTFFPSDFEDLPGYKLTSESHGITNKVLGKDLFFDELHAHYVFFTTLLNEKNLKKLFKVCSILLKDGGTFIHSAEYGLKPELKEQLPDLLKKYDLELIKQDTETAFTTSAREFQNNDSDNLNLTIWARKK